MEKAIYYFDNAATSFPKPKEVIDAWVEYSTKIGASPGRGNYGLSIKGSELIDDSRKQVANLIKVNNPKRIAFFKNATEALNVAIFGLLKKGDHVISSITEHNATRRPLNRLCREEVIDVDFTPSDSNGYIHAESIFARVRKETRFVVLNGVSNVTGLMAPVREIGEYCVNNDIIFILDAAQMIGIVDIDVNRDNIDLMGFTGHKGLLGPTGTGGLYYPIGIEPEPILWGGTGGMSDLACMPDVVPMKYEAGTCNTAGIHALGAGVKYVSQKGVENIKKHKIELVDHFLSNINSIDKIHIIGPREPTGERLGIVSFWIDGIGSKEFALKLWEKYNIAVRGGLHCAPLIHEYFKIDGGSVRFSFGNFNTKDNVDYAIDAVKKLLK